MLRYHPESVSLLVVSRFLRSCVPVLSCQCILFRLSQLISAVGAEGYAFHIWIPCAAVRAGSSQSGPTESTILPARGNLLLAGRTYGKPCLKRHCYRPIEGRRMIKATW